MPNQDMLFPILPRPTPPVNLHEIVHHDVPRVEKQPEMNQLDTEQHHRQQSPHDQHTTPHSPDDVSQNKDEGEQNSTTPDSSKHSEHIDIFI